MSCKVAGGQRRNASEGRAPIANADECHVLRGTCHTRTSHRKAEKSRDIEGGSDPHPKGNKAVPTTMPVQGNPTAPTYWPYPAVTICADAKTNSKVIQT
jgi:hypothetical protein